MSAPGVPAVPAAVASSRGVPGPYADIESLLRANGLPQYIEKFVAENVDLELLRSLSSQDAKVPNQSMWS